MAIPENGRVRKKDDEKVEKYQDLAREVRKMWDVMTKVTSVVSKGGIRISTNESEKNLTGSRQWIKAYTLVRYFSIYARPLML